MTPVVVNYKIWKESDPSDIPCVKCEFKNACFIYLGLKMKDILDLDFFVSVNVK
jgi:hypothetical protein